MKHCKTCNTSVDSNKTYCEPCRKKARRQSQLNTYAKNGVVGDYGYSLLSKKVKVEKPNEEFSIYNIYEYPHLLVGGTE